MKKYKLQSHKIHNQKVRLHFISDLHGLSLGEKNSDLLEIIHRRKPDVVLLGGDMIVSAHRETWQPAMELLELLSREYSVVYAMGNHELKAPDYMEQYGTYILRNENRVIQIEDNSLCVRGLSLDGTCFRKPFPRKLAAGELKELLGSTVGSESFEILLAHNPFYGDAYFQYGSDLILSGHYHGGVVRFTENVGLVSTHFHPFPRYCCGRFDREDQTMIVSAGLGEHTVSLRIHNPRELLEIDLLPLYKSDVNK